MPPRVGADVILTGAGNVSLKADVAVIEASPLPAGVAKRLAELFGNVDCVSGKLGRAKLSACGETPYT